MAVRKHFAVVEDDDQDLARLTLFLERYAQERQLEIRTSVFRDGLDFVEAYTPVYDLVLMDVEMPHMDGLKTARRMREMDAHVPLIFITRMAQYAINGYEVSALDYLLKPISYGTLVTKLEHALRYAEEQAFRQDDHLFLNVGADSYKKVSTRDILYIVKDHNYLRYVTHDEEYRVRGTMKELEDHFAGTTIIKCANGCMVNLRHIEQKVRNTITVGGVQFAITRPCQEEFTEKFMQFLRGGY